VDGRPAHRNHVDFRDYLREHPDQAKRYAERKREVAHLLVVDREAYVAAKSDVIEEMLRRAHGDERGVKSDRRRGG
jgi:GrpB-like predicted nucleotidyltransferase (UPF0157 family)